MSLKIQVRIHNRRHRRHRHHQRHRRHRHQVPQHQIQQQAHQVQHQRLQIKIRHLNRRRVKRATNSPLQIRKLFTVKLRES